MAARISDSGAISRQNMVEIEFIDEDELPIANFVEHRESDDGLDSDFEEEEEEEEENADIPGLCEADQEENEWSRDINVRDDVAFDQPVGPTIQLQDNMNAVDYFQLYFTEAVWNLLVEQTNLYAQQKRGPDDSSVWYPVTVDEFKAWVAMILNMGIVQKPTIHLYWRTTSTIQTPFFPSIMSRDRFLQIMRYLHFTDNQEEVRDKNSPDYDKLFKIRKLIDLLLPRLSEVYNPERNLAIDETLVKFKGKIYFRQFIPIKPGRFGIKCFTLAESSSGYVLVSKIYTGKEQGVQQKDLGRRVVMDLMEKFLDKGYVLFMDNYYSSVPLFQELSSRGTLACGTVRSNRKGLPKDITNPGSREVKGLNRGESLYRQKGAITCVGWKDRKMVYMLSTTPVDPSSTIEIEITEGQ